MLDKIQFSKAPVSEVIIGQSFDSDFLQPADLVLIAQALLGEYQNPEFLGPIADEVLTEGMITRNLSIDQTGRMLVRMWTEDRQWLVQFQGNKILVNWMRQDREYPERQYPGFGALLKRYQEALAAAREALGRSLPPTRDFELTYHDRVPISKSEPFHSEFSKTMQISPMPTDEGNDVQCLEFKQTHLEPRIGGYGNIILNNAIWTDEKSIRLIQFQYTVRGILPGGDMEEWMRTARIVQNEQFHRAFTKDTLDTWV